MEQTNDYRFKLREWLLPLAPERKRSIIDKIVSESGQSRFTVRRIAYMKLGDNSYVRPETKAIICRILKKSLSEFENQ